jgi:DTW domain-containing protein YfiP
MHPKEFKREKAGTGRLTHLCLAESEIHMGVEFDQHEAVQDLIRCPTYLPVLLYPGEQAYNLTNGAAGLEQFGERQLLVFLLDATWSGARKMLRLSPSLQRLPRIMFTPSAPSRYVIKQQPQDGCLSTLEATHELLVALEQVGLDRYSHPEQLLALFDRMQKFQISCAQDPARAGYRRQAYSEPGERVRPQGRSGARRSRYLQRPILSEQHNSASPPLHTARDRGERSSISDTSALGR